MPSEKRRIYFICPVRNCTAEQRAEMDQYVQQLEKEGAIVHYPPRDVDQTNDDGGVRICREHMEWMEEYATEVHVFWADESKGCHYDLGLAAMLNHVFGDYLKIVWANPTSPVKAKSFQNVLAGMTK